MRTVMLASVGVAAIGLSRIQRSRVRAIGQLVADRTRLLDDLVHVEQRERQVLSERLHDGALQYVLAARHDLEDVRDGDHPGAVDRIDHALAESSRMLRSTVSELHPAVLDRVGLAQAVRDLVAGSRRHDLAIDVDVDGWPDGVRTPVDDLLFSAARELLSNVVRHAGATRATVTLELDERDGDAGRHRRRHRDRRRRSRAEPRRRPHRPALAGAARRGGGRHAARRARRVGHRRHRRRAGRRGDALQSLHGECHRMGGWRARRTTMEM